MSKCCKHQQATPFVFNDDSRNSEQGWIQDFLIGVSMFTFSGMINLTMVVNSTNKQRSLTEISGLGLCDFNAKSVKLIDDK